MTCNPLVRWLERSFQLLGDLRLRALNLVWSLVESDFISCRGNGASKKKIAIVGGGFVGPTIAAGLIEKDVNAEITIFEERDFPIDFVPARSARLAGVQFLQISDLEHPLSTIPARFLGSREAHGCDCSGARRIRLT